MKITNEIIFGVLLICIFFGIIVYLFWRKDE
jgi:hypothetical protein